MSCTDTLCLLDLGVFSFKITLLSTVFLDMLVPSLTLLEGSVLTWHPVGVSHALCMCEEQSEDLWPLGLSLSQCRHVFTYSVKYRILKLT